MAEALRRNPAVLVLIGVLVMIGALFVLMVPARAHGVTLVSSAAVVCDTDGLALRWTATSWGQTDDAGRDPDINVELRADGGPWMVVANGELTDANGRTLAGVVTVPPGALALDLRVGPDPDVFWEGTDITTGGDGVSVAVPPFPTFCEADREASPTAPERPTPVPAPTPTASPDAIATAQVTTPAPSSELAPIAAGTTEPAATPTEAETPTAPLPPAEEPAASPTTVPPTPPPPEEAPASDLSRSAGIVCTDTGVIVAVLGEDGDVFDVLVDGAPAGSLTVDVTGAATLPLDQEPGGTNTFEVRFGGTVLASGTFGCVEGSTSPGTSPGEAGPPRDPAAPEVLGQVTPREQQLAETGFESGMLGVFGGTMLAAGWMLVSTGVAQQRREAQTLPWVVGSHRF